MNELELVAEAIMKKGYATGHGDTIEDLLAELEWQVAEREREAVLEAIEALTGMEADRHKMFSEGYDHALYHIRQVVEGRSKKYAMYALQQAIEFEEMVKKGTKAWDGTPDDWVDELRGGAEKREWVGLTDEDIYKVIEENIPPQLNTLFDMAKWVGGVIEAKLKEKNGWQ